MVKKKNSPQGKKKDELLSIKDTKQGKKRRDDPFRCGLTHLCEETPKIKDWIKDRKAHKKALRQCPFWNFYRPFHDGVMNLKELKKKMEAVKMVLRTFDKQNPRTVPDCFKIKRMKNLTLHTISEHFSVTFGLQMMEQVNVEKDKDLTKRVNCFVNEYFGGKKKMKKKAILEAMELAAGDEAKADDFVRLFVLYLLMSIFVPNKGGQNLPSKYLFYVFEMNKVSWPDVLHENLMHSLSTAKSVEDVTGCVLYPVYWLAEMSHITAKKGGIYNNYPRFARWNLDAVCHEIMDKFKDGGKKFDSDIFSKMNVGHRNGSFLDPYSESEERLVVRLQEKDLVFEEDDDHEESEDNNEEQVESEDNLVVADSEENDDNEGSIPRSEENSYEVKYRFARMLIAKLTTACNNELSEEDKALLAKYDAEDELVELDKEVLPSNDAEEEIQPAVKTYSRKKRKIDQVSLLQKEKVPSEPEKVPSEPEKVQYSEVVNKVTRKDAAVEDERIDIAELEMALLHEGKQLEDTRNTAESEDVVLEQERIQPCESAIQGYEDFLMEPENVSLPGNADCFMEAEKVSRIEEAEQEQASDSVSADNVGGGNEDNLNNEDNADNADNVHGSVCNAEQKISQTEEAEQQQVSDSVAADNVGGGNEDNLNNEDCFMEAEEVSQIEDVEQEQVSLEEEHLPVQREEEEVQPVLSPNTIEEIKVAEEVESRLCGGKCSSSKTPYNTEEEVFDGFGQLTIDDENFIRKMETEYAKKGRCSKPAIKRDYYYSVAKIARDIAQLEVDGPSFDLGLTQQGNIGVDEMDDQNRDSTPEQVLSNMITRMKNERRKIVVPIKMRDYIPFGETKPKPKIAKKLASKKTTPKKVTALKVKLKPVDRLKIIKDVLNEDQKPIVCRYFKENCESDLAWECKKFGLQISGRVLSDLVRKGDVSQNIIEFYMMKLQQHIVDGTQKYNTAVFLSTYACVLHEMGRNCVGAIEKFIEQMDYSVRFLFIPLMTKLGEGVYHWTLLSFDNETGEFYHYNSMKSSEAMCRRTALSMKQRVVSAFRDHVAEIDEPISQDKIFEMVTPSCCEQKGLDCGLHVCYYMKSLLKGNMKSPEENISEKVERMRAKLCYKILVDEKLKEI